MEGDSHLRDSPATMARKARNSVISGAIRKCAILSLFALAACSQERVQIAHPPVALTQCDDEPQAPSLPPVDWSSLETARPIQRQRDEVTLTYILGLRSAYGSCKGVVAGVKAWSDGL